MLPLFTSPLFRPSAATEDFVDHVIAASEEATGGYKVSTGCSTMHALAKQD